MQPPERERAADIGGKALPDLAILEAGHGGDVQTRHMDAGLHHIADRRHEAQPFEARQDQLVRIGGRRRLLGPGLGHGGGCPGGGLPGRDLIVILRADSLRPGQQERERANAGCGMDAARGGACQCHGVLRPKEGVPGASSESWCQSMVKRSGR